MCLRYCQHIIRYSQQGFPSGFPIRKIPTKSSTQPGSPGWQAASAKSCNAIQRVEPVHPRHPRHPRHPHWRVPRLSRWTPNWIALGSRSSRGLTSESTMLKLLIGTCLDTPINAQLISNVITVIRLMWVTPYIYTHIIWRFPDCCCKIEPLNQFWEWLYKTSSFGHGNMKIPEVDHFDGFLDSWFNHAGDLVTVKAGAMPRETKRTKTDSKFDSHALKCLHTSGIIWLRFGRFEARAYWMRLDIPGCHSKLALASPG